MQKIKGSQRLVLLIGPIAIKFPRLHYRWFGVPKLIKLVLFGDQAELATFWLKIRLNLLRGIIANLTEATAYLWFRAPFLVPVISCGFFSIQLREYGETPTTQEITAILEQLPEHERTELFQLNHHHFDGNNWKKNERGYRLVDYGDSYGDFVSLSGFLIFNHEDMSVLLCKK